MKRTIITALLMLLSLYPFKTYAYIVNIAEFHETAYASSSGLSVFGQDNRSGYFTVGIGDLDYFTMFTVYPGDVGHTLSYWNGPPILPGVDTGNYFIRTITGYEFTTEEARGFGSQMPMIYGFDSAAVIHHEIVPNPLLGDQIINGIFLDVSDSSTNGIPDISTRLYADVENAPVPEPSTCFLLAAGIAGIGYHRRKIRHHGAASS